ncbi:glutamate ABC transporter substrate-binding protein [Corynebacterium sp. ES2794-CONJ1]|uniref:glutamate ABC transporter substrate-binding protein n=1 Tax=Corynebacterium sp. ES2794-CONJ1 TaxID=2980553 RepID=UPI0021D9F71D|nr:glutamate ABC transporter substrate-binding protein [Corynebacterium sp. ES2794-CONJ1]
MKNSHSTSIASMTTLAIAGLATLTSCGSTEESGAGLIAHIEAGSVTVGTKFNQPGLGLKEASGELTGLDVDVATHIVNRIAADNGWEEPEITWRECPSSQRETLIQNGEVDLIAATYSINKSRTEAVNFGGPYLLTHQALLVRLDDDQITRLEDLGAGKILCSVSGSTPARKVKDSLPDVQLQEYDTYSSCVEALRQGNVDAMTTDATILNGYAAQDEGAFTVIEMTKDDMPFTDEHYGIGLAKDDREATDAVNKALQEMYDSGDFAALITKNLGKNATGVSTDVPGDLAFIG